MRRALLAYVPAAVALARKRRELEMPRWLGTMVAAGVPVCVAAAMRPGRGRAAATWAAQMWAYKIAFEAPYDDPDALRARLRVEGPARLDRALGLGVEPTLR